MQAVILVGGEGTRLRPLTYDLPKPMTPIFNKPYLEHLINWLKRNDITDIILTSCFKPEVFQEYFQNGEKWGARLSYVVEETPLGTAGAVKNAASLIKGTFLTFNGDVLLDLDLKELLDYHLKKRGKATLTLTYVKDITGFGVVETDTQGQIKQFKEKPKPEEVTTNFINAGVYILEPEVLNKIPENCKFSFERELFPGLLNEGEKLFAFKQNSYWIDIGNPLKYKKVHRDFLKGKVKLDLDITPKREGLWIETGCQISERAKISPPVFIGQNSKIEDDAVIHPFSVIGRNCKIHSQAQIKEAIIWSGCQIGEKAFLDNCILGRSCKVNPGIKILPDKIIGSFEQISK